MNASIAERYIRAAHAVNLHHDGFIDAYFGYRVWSEPFSSNLNDLEIELEQLQTEILELMPIERRAFLTVQIRAMQTIVRLKRGQQRSFLEEARGLYDIEPIRKPESQFEAAHQALEQLLPGTGLMMDRWQTFRQKFKIAPERLQPVIDVINLELQRRSHKLFDLTAAESCEFVMVQNKPWSGYNWYLGNGRSRIDINTDLPKYLYEVPNLVAHEAYPGHHTEHIVKENKLMHIKDWQEFSIQLLNSSESVLAEGIATSALEVVMPQSELHNWISQELAQVAGLKLTLEEVQIAFQIGKARDTLDYVQGNAALMLFQDHETEITILEYIQHSGLHNLTEARKQLEFIHHARGYVYTYTTGHELLKTLFEHGDKIEIFKRLLEEPFTPSQLRDWAAETRASKEMQ